MNARVQSLNTSKFEHRERWHALRSEVFGFEQGSMQRRSAQAELQPGAISSRSRLAGVGIVFHGVPGRGLVRLIMSPSGPR